MGLLADLAAAKAEVTRIEGEIAALPSEIVGKTEAEMVAIWHSITTYFGGTVPAPTQTQTPAA